MDDKGEVLGRMVWSIMKGIGANWQVVGLQDSGLEIWVSEREGRRLSVWTKSKLGGFVQSSHQGS